MKNALYFTLGAATIIVGIMVMSYTKPDSLPLTDSAAMAQQAQAAPQQLQWQPAQEVHAPIIPDEINFAGEPLPQDNFDAVERFDRELISNCFRHSATFLFFKRANRYFPIIERILKEEGVPDDMKYLAVAESALENAVSPAGARGFWQFMPGSARERGLEVGSEVDERYHLEKATRAACAYLKEAKAEFGSWMLAAASYNMGKAGLRKNLNEQGNGDYFSLNLNPETARYVLRILAIKEIMQHPKRYGFHFEPSDLYQAFPPYKTVAIKSNVESWSAFAKKHNTTYRMLKVYNPWLRSDGLNNRSQKTYHINLPI